MKTADELIRAFTERFTFIACSERHMKEAARNVVGMPDDIALDLMMDYIMSNDLAEEVIL